MSYRPPPGECTYDTDACSRRKGSDTVIPQKRQTICAFVLRALHTNIYIHSTLYAVRWTLCVGTWRREMLGPRHGTPGPRRDHPSQPRPISSRSSRQPVLDDDR